MSARCKSGDVVEEVGLGQTEWEWGSRLVDERMRPGKIV